MTRDERVDDCAWDAVLRHQLLASLGEPSDLDALCLQLATLRRVDPRRVQARALAIVEQP